MKKPVPITPELLTEISGSALKIYSVLTSNADAEGAVEFSLDEIAERTGLTERTVRTARAELFEKKLTIWGQVLSEDHTPGRGYRSNYKVNSLSTVQAKAVQDGNAVERKNFPPSKSPSYTLPFITSKAVQRREIKKGEKISDKKADKSCPKLSLAEELLTLDEATKIIGMKCNPNSLFGGRVRSSLRARIKEGFSKNDLIVACRYAEKTWQNGDRWIKLRDLSWIWARGFEVLLATKGEAGSRPSKKAPVFRSGAERDEWEKQIRRSLGEEVE